MSGERAFAYRARGKDGRLVSDVIQARDRAEGVRRLLASGLTPVAVEEAAADGPARPALAGLRARGPRPGDRVLVLRQLAVLTAAGVDLLEALETVGEALARTAVGGQLRAVAVGLRRGDGVARAFAEGAPGMPDYVYALLRAGEASGALAAVLSEAADQLAGEAKIEREVRAALAYPAFLIGAGALAVAFMLYAVVPRFASMVGANLDRLDGLAALVIGAGLAFQTDAPLVLGSLGAAALAIGLAARSPAGRQALAAAARRAPLLGGVAESRERARWARIMAFSTAAGVALLDAASLAAAAAPGGRFGRSLDGARQALRAGRPVDEAFAQSGALETMDIALLRAGQRSGALASMFKAVAERHEEELFLRLKRLTTLVEPLAIGVVSLMIGAIVIGLVTAMTSVYDVLQ